MVVVVKGRRTLVRTKRRKETKKMKEMRKSMSIRRCHRSVAPCGCVGCAIERWTRCKRLRGARVPHPHRTRELDGIVAGRFAVRSSRFRGTLGRALVEYVVGCGVGAKRPWYWLCLGIHHFDGRRSTKEVQVPCRDKYRPQTVLLMSPTKSDERKTETAPSASVANRYVSLAHEQSAASSISGKRSSPVTAKLPHRVVRHGHA